MKTVTTPDMPLKPCPFCGNKDPELIDNSDETYEEFYVICQPKCVWGASRTDVIEAVEAWNERI